MKYVSSSYAFNMLVSINVLCNTSMLVPLLYQYRFSKLLHFIRMQKSELLELPSDLHLFAELGNLLQNPSMFF